MRGVICIAAFVAAAVVCSRGDELDDWDLSLPYTRRGIFEPLSQDKSDIDKVKEAVVPCPVCPGDRCEQLDGRYVKVCRFGVHSNQGCNNRIDCYRGPGELCSEDHSRLCVRSLSCRDHQCRGFSLFGAYNHDNYASKNH